MKNRAKCKLCQGVLESFHEFDLVSCKCGEISISGGGIRYECAAKNWDNFLRIDDEGKEIGVVVKDEANVKDDPAPVKKIDKQELKDAVAHLIASTEGLPEHAKLQAANQYDMLSILYIIQSSLEV